MMNAVRRAMALLFLACMIQFPAAALAADDAGGAWMTLYRSGALNNARDSGPWRYGLYGDVRYQDRREGINQYILQPAIGFRLNSRLSLWGGYTNFRSETGGKLTLNEHRGWQQLSWKLADWNSASLKSRTRLEERFRESLDGTDLRLRQDLRLNTRLPFTSNARYILGNEFFYHLRDTTWSRQGYGQNRFYTGVGWNFQKVSVEALYMHQSYKLRNSPDRVNHLLVLNFRG